MTRRDALAAVALALLLATAGCSDLFQFGARDDPDDDRIGWEDGHWYDDDLSIEPGDGLNGSERRAVVARTMARVERIRGLEFEKRVPVEVITRTEYRERRAGRTGAPGHAEFAAWNNQVWEALFLVGEDRDVSEALKTVYGSSVTGFYSPSDGRIVVVSDDDTPRLDRRTLSHELVHALQDQHFGLPGNASTQDGQLATDGLVEGDASLVERRYERRCGGRWSCLAPPEQRGGGQPPGFLQGVFLTVFSPYAAGPEFVAALHQRGGWDAVNAAHDDYPASMEQVIHPERYPDEAPADVRVPDRSAPGWSRFDHDPHYDTVGEASVYAMFWANGQVDRRGAERYNYSHSLSSGWAGDRVVPYRNGDRYGYVWKTVWDTEADAREFVRGYRRVLRSHNATRTGNVYVVPDSNPYGDAFRVTRRGDTVVVVNAPTRGELDDVHG